MLCTNCYRKIDSNLTHCPHCNARVDKTVIRCPECWKKHKADTIICDKCGCNIPKSLKENDEISKYKAPTIAEKIKRLPMKLKVGIAVFLCVIIVLGIVCSIVYLGNRKSEIKKLSLEMVEMSDEAIEEITSLAECYENDVYDRDWITYMELAQALREKYDDEIKDIKKAREPISHKRNQIKATGHKKAAALADRLYYCYSDCYGYVIGENGKYPYYLKKYNKLVDEYRKAAEELIAVGN